MANEINVDMLIGHVNSDWRIGFKWLNRYSDTNETDNRGRWARKAFYNGICIAWVNGSNKAVDKKVDWHISLDNSRETYNVDVYRVSLFFPTTANDNPTQHACFTDFEGAKKYVEEMFLSFKTYINKHDK